MGAFRRLTSAPGCYRPLVLASFPSAPRISAHGDRLSGSRRIRPGASDGLRALLRWDRRSNNADPMVMIHALLLDQIVSLVLRKDLANPVRTNGNGHFAGKLGQPLAPPSRDIGTEHLRFFEADLDFGREPPPAGPTAAGATIVRREAAGEPDLRGAVSSGCGFLFDECAVDDFVSASLLRDGEEVDDRRLCRGRSGRRERAMGSPRCSSGRLHQSLRKA